jgi:pilus assembly protein Flp/PilA
MGPTLWREFLRDEDGTTATEYAVMLVLIICAVIAAVNAVGGTNAGGWNRSVTIITNAITAAGS